jgi:amino acid adenylation domain-containing protein
LGRNDFQVKIRGFRIELGEIEARLREQEGVREAVVIAREDVPGEKRLVAYYVAVAGEDSEPAAEELREQLSARLPEYMVPAAYVRIEVLPLTANGKLDRKALPEPEQEAFVTRRYEAPQGEVEATLARIWEEVLKVERVGRHDNFFELGGHSLLAMTVMERMRRQGVAVEVRTLFAAPMLADLALAVGTKYEEFVTPPNLIEPECKEITPAMLPLVELSAVEIEAVVRTVPGGAANVQDIYPLAPLQEGILFHHLITKNADPYVLSGLYSFVSYRQLERYLEALDAVIERHDVLRTAIVWERLLTPVQVVWREARLPIEEVVLKTGTPEELYERFNPRSYSMDVSIAPLLRGYIAYDPRRDFWYCLILFHHLIVDHSTWEVMQAEIQAHLLGREEKLREPIPFRNFVARARLGISADEHEGFFSGMLGDVDEPTAPFGFVDVQADRSTIRQARLEVTLQMGRRLRHGARRLGVSAASLCHLAWGQVLARLSGKDDVVFGTVLFGRMQGGEEADRVMGLLINTLPIRIQLGQESVVAAVRQTQESLNDLMRHEHASLALAQRCSGVEAPTPLFTALFNYRHSASWGGAAGSARTKQGWEGIETLALEERTNYPMTFIVDDFGEIFELTAHVRAPLEPEGVCNFMHRALEQLVEALEFSPQKPIRELDVLPAAEWARVIEEWNTTEREYPPEECVHVLFEMQVARTPEAVAVMYEGERLSYRELNARANRLAHELRSLGVGPDDRVAICVERGLEMVVGILGVLKAGGAYVPLDPAYPAERLSYILEDSKPKVLLCESKLLREGAVPRMEGLRVLDLSAPESGWGKQPVSNLSKSEVGVTLQHLAYIIYTSGSTGQPKGVMIEHGNVSRLFAATEEWFGFSEKDVWTLFHSCAFDFSVWELWGALLYGGRLVVVGLDVARSPEDFYKLLCREEVTVLNQTPSAFRQLIAAQGKSESEHCLKHVIFGGEALDVTMLKPWFERNDEEATRLVNMYGITETTVHVTYRRLEREDAERGGPSPIGRRIPDLKLYILDRHGRPAPIGVEGELYVGGAGVARGYLNRPELTAQRFWNDPFSKEAGARIYRTGDLGRWLPDGNIEFLGRNDFQVKIRGFRIELGEIEARLREQEGVAEAVVAEREDSPGEKRLVAYYVAAQDSAHPSAEELREQLSERLPEYMVPAAYMRLGSLPLTANGKLDRKALPEPEQEAFVTRRYEAPQGEVEATLARIWEEVLKVQRVGRHDNFFELGGDSIRTISIAAKAKEKGLLFGIDYIFRYPSIGRLAAAISAEARGVSPLPVPAAPVTTLIRESDKALLPDDVEDAYSLSRLQLGMVFHNQLTPDLGTYHDVFSDHLRIRDWDIERFTSVLEAMVRKHAILRTSFDLHRYSEPLQLVHQDATIPIRAYDISALEVAAQEKAIADFIASEKQVPFDLERAPLLRIFIHRRSDDTIQYTLSFHHAILDGWSVASFQTELFRQYLDWDEQAQRELEPLKSSFRNLVALEKATLASEGTKTFWSEYLDHASVSSLPPLEEGEKAATNRLEVNVSQELQAGLMDVAQKLQVPLRTILLTAHLRVISLLSGKQDIVTGMVTHSRLEERDGDEVLGMFLNTLPFRLKLKPNSWANLIRATFDTELSIMPHRAYPYFQILLENDRTPLYETAFNYVNFHIYRALQDDGAITWLGGSAFEETNFAFGLNTIHQNEALKLVLAFDPARFTAAQVRRFSHYYLNVLESISADLQAQHNTTDYLSAAERRQVMKEWNATECQYPREKCVHELFETQAERSPEAVAVVYDGQELSYGELNTRANQVAHELRNLGVGPDNRVAICVERGLEMVVGILGVLKAGGAYVPLDPAYPAERLSYMLEDSEPKAVLSQGKLLRAGTLPQTKDMPVVDLNAPESGWGQRSLSNLNRSDVGLTPRHLAYIIYTSGSTGRPKGVMVEHRSVCNMFAAQTRDFRIATGVRMLQFASFSFDGFVFEFVSALCRGGSLHIPSATTPLVGDALSEMISEHRITTAVLPPAVLANLDNATDLGSLTTLIISGDVLSGSLARRWQCDRHLVNGYGPTEATVCATSYHFSPLTPQTIPIGRPVANTRIYILDCFGQPSPIGVGGEIHIGGAGVARGYFNRPELTAGRFLVDPFSKESGARMYRTGDLGRWLPDGNIEFLGRNDFQVKIRGFRIELGEIEARLREHEGVSEAVVVAREGVPGEKRLVAYYVVKQDSAGPTAEELRVLLSAQLPEYMVPAAYVRLEALPLTANGKLDRKALPAPDQEAFVSRRYEAPEGEVEEALARIWEEVLKVEPVGRHDNFFELGGHSLLAVTVMERMRRKGLAGDVRMLFSAPTLADLALVVGGKGEEVVVPPNLIEAGCEEITPELLPLVRLRAAEIEAVVRTVPGGAANVQDIYPLAPLQEGILFHHLVTKEGDPYLLSRLYSFNSRLRLEQYLEALNGVIARHDILRTAIVWEGVHEPVQVVWRKATIPVEEILLPRNGGSAEEEQTKRFDPRYYRMDVSRAPLMRAYIAQDRDRWLLLTLNHHLAGDHTTLEVMEEEIQAHLLGRERELRKPIPFRNFVAHARLGISADEHEEFFRRMLADVDEPTAPFGILDAQGDGSGIRQGWKEVRRELGAGLRQGARRLGVSVASLCHLAWAQVLARLSNREDVVFGTVLFGRMQGGEGVDRVMGLFINTLPIRIKLGQESVTEAARGTQASLSELIRHEHASLALAQRCSGVEAPTPLFTSLFNYRHSATWATQTCSAETKQAWEGIEPLAVEERTNYPVTFSVDDFGDWFGLTAQVRAPLEAERLCNLMHRALEVLADALEALPQKPIRELDVLPPVDRTQVIEEWNAAERQYARKRCIHELFEAQVERTPDAVAAVYNADALSYTALNGRANQVAHELRSLGVGPDDRVAICVERGLEMVVGILAVLKAGGGYVPLDPAYPAERLNYMLEDCNPKVLLSEGKLLQDGALASLRPDFSVVDLNAPESGWGNQSTSNISRSEVGVTSDHLAYIIYTSGSTGQPKGVMIEHGNVSRLFAATEEWFGFSEKDVWTLFHSYAFDFSVWELWGALLYGGKLVVVGLDVARSPKDFHELLCREGVTVLNQTPSAFRQLISVQGKSDREHCLKHVIFGGEALDVTMLKPWFERNDEERTRLVNM